MSDKDIVTVGKYVIIIVAIVCITLFLIQVIKAFRTIKVKQIEENIARMFSAGKNNGSYHSDGIRADFEDGKTKVAYEQPRNEAEQSQEQEKTGRDTLFAFLNNIIQFVPKLKK